MIHATHIIVALTYSAALVLVCLYDWRLYRRRWVMPTVAVLMSAGFVASIVGCWLILLD